MRKWSYLLHLSRRTWHSYTARPLSEADLLLIRELLLPQEFELWNQFGVEDKSHSFVVWKRFMERIPHASIAQQRSALLHDIGKIAVQLSTTQRVIATFVGPRTIKYRTYHDHENIGLQMLNDRSNQETVELLRALYQYEEEKNTDDFVEENSIDIAIVVALSDADNV
jgi:hypothetical protein